MLPKAIRLLLIDDDEEDYVLTRDLLDDIAEVEFELEWLADGDLAVDAIREARHDLYLVDYSLGSRDGLSIIREAVAHGASAPIILLTGRDGRAIDLDAMSAGVADFLEKWRLTPTLLERSIRYSLQERRHAEELERRVLERTVELARANEALRDADRRKNEYLSTLAHELRNPLVPIRNALEIMRLDAARPSGNPTVVEDCRSMIERQVRHIVRLIDELTMVARISRGMIRLKPGPVSVARMVEAAEENIRPFIAKRRHQFEVTLPDDPPTIHADAERMAQVLYNLLHNAAKYTEPGGRVRLHVELEGDGVSFRVVDDGPGVPEAMWEAVFDIFTQVKRDGEEEVASGLGVGLWLVKRLVELHGGRVSARSGPGGRGSEFVVWIPSTPPEADGAGFA
jgi:signal transduction histidine kinase